MNLISRVVVVLAFFEILTVTDALIWPCETNTDCTATTSFCSTETSTCECDSFDTVITSDLTTCLKTSLFGDQCEDSVQCNLMPSGAKCKSGVCDCADGYTYAGGRCRLLNGLDSSCETSSDCIFGYDRVSVTCQDNVCKCADGYYQRSGNICRLKSMKIGDACVVHTDCENIGPNVQCNSLRCVEVSESPKAASNEPETTTADTTTPTNTHTKSDIGNEKSPNFVYTSQLSKSTSTSETSKDTLALVNGRSDLTDDLDNEEEERSSGGGAGGKNKSREIAVQTSIDSFELKPLKRLVKNVGTATISSSGSRRNFSRYRQLRNAFRFDDDGKSFSTLSNTDDDLDDKRYGSSCTENGKICAGLPHSICSHNTCVCRSGYYPYNNKCYAELGEIAESAKECQHAFDILSNKCVCQNNFFYEKNLRSCRKPIQYHLSCTSDSQCSPFGAAYCSTGIPRRCTCEEYAEYDELRQLCMYKEGLGEFCDTNKPCNSIPNAFCSNNYCACRANYMEKNKACVPGIGANCEADIECGIENSICDITSDETNRACQCKKGYVHFKDECLKEAEELDDECVETAQCKPLLGTCIDKKCACTHEQHVKLGRCEEKKVINDACTRSTQCFDEKEPENIECRNSVCQCKFGYQANKEKKTCIRVVSSNKNSSGRPSALKIITFLLIGAAFLITSAAIKQAYYD
ncbi:prion-like-(Q/N-rich) domain-bearing protein 25 isoform X2 [Eurosta solidaginis]|uniref:prion-like-(Q/N-rich) domain-bearing protein 25 isoform X2 n=1 Tax=Eurosta solidaginis TaxID=178769 RepID=UPI0035314379